MAKHLLVVDDEAPTRELLGLFFRARGFAVTAASSGAEGRALLRQGVYDLLILDIELGDANGLDLLPEIRSACPAMPVIIFTGLQTTDVMLQRAREAGAAGFLSKTQPLDSMLEIINQNLPQGR